MRAEVARDWGELLALGMTDEAAFLAEDGILADVLMAQLTLDGCASVIR